MTYEEFFNISRSSILSVSSPKGYYKGVLYFKENPYLGLLYNGAVSYFNIDNYNFLPCGDRLYSVFSFPDYNPSFVWGAPYSQYILQEFNSYNDLIRSAVGKYFIGYNLSNGGYTDLDNVFDDFESALAKVYSVAFDQSFASIRIYNITSVGTVIQFTGTNNNFPYYAMTGEVVTLYGFSLSAPCCTLDFSPIVRLLGGVAV